MTTERLLAKLRWDDPRALFARALHRRVARRARARRRRRWQDPAAWLDLAGLPADPSPAGAEHLWPGATERGWIREAVRRWPAWHAEAAARAAAAARGEFDLLSSGPIDVRRPGGGLRWHDDFKSGVGFPADCLYMDVPICLEREGTDIKVPWELSRFQHVFAFLWTDPDAYRDVFLAQWRDWLAQNPLARGVNWACTMDVALRAITWTAAVAAWGRTFDADTRRRMWVTLAEHGHFIRDNLEWVPVARTNHYFSDIVGLAVLGAVLAPYPPALGWAAFAARELRRETLRQFARDGLNCECSTTYHRLMVELATLGLLASRVGGHDLGPAVRARLVAAYRAVKTLCDAAGRVPLIGDNDSSRVFPMVQEADDGLGGLLPLGAAALEEPGLASGEPRPEVALLCGAGALDRSAGRTATEAAPAGQRLGDSGLFVLGPPPERMVIRCGPLSYRPAGSHKHIDQLSLAVSVAGQPILVDPGQYAYTPWPAWRDRFIGSAAHNTVLVDGQPQCRFYKLGWMPFSIVDEARPRCVTWTEGVGVTRFVGQHRGYRRLPGGADHRRAVSYEAAAHRWVVRDELPLRGRHRVTWVFQLHPQVHAEWDGERWSLTSGAATLRLSWTGTVRPAAVLEAGWYAPAYGCKLAAGRLVFELDAEGPVDTTFVLEAEGSR